MADDKRCFLHDKTSEARAAAQCGDTRRSFAIVKQLAGLSCAPKITSIRKGDGSFTESESERQERWQEHFDEVFQGKVMNKSRLVPASARDAANDSEVDVSPSAVERSYAKLGKCKGVGPDPVPAELLHAGGGATAVQYSKFYRRVVSEERWLVTWTGGRIVDVYKRKGDPAVSDSSRGVLLATHASKGFANILAEEVDPLYEKNMPECQNGAVASRGTDFAGHIIRCLLGVANLASLSIFVLFIDLVKAFDQAVREIVFGFPEDVEDPLEYLLTIGLTASIRHYPRPTILAMGREA